MCAIYSPLNSIYMRIIKALLSVRKTTCNDLCLVEADMPPLAWIIQHKRTKYIRNRIPDLQEGDPLKHSVDLVRDSNTSSFRLIQEVLQGPVCDIVQEVLQGPMCDIVQEILQGPMCDIVQESMGKLREKTKNSVSTKRMV